MTNEEAIKILNRLVFVANNTDIHEKKEAINMGIKALEKQTRTCETCKYAIPAGRLVGCLNTEINITSCQSNTFYCNKWEKDE